MPSIGDEYRLGDCTGDHLWRNERYLFVEGGSSMIYLIIIGMSLATMIPRIVPAFIVDKLQFRDWVNRWLHAIPYAALGVLIFPGILTVQQDQPHVGLIGGLVAIALAYIGLNVILVVIGAISAVFLLSM